MVESRKGSLVVVGTGYRIAGQTTPEALHHLKKSDVLFYLVYDPITERWVRSLNASAVSLRKYFRQGRLARDCCNAIVDRILRSLRRGLNVCAAFSGHPSVCLNPSHDALRRARSEGFRTKMLPAVSSVDCMFADLGVDPVGSGCHVLDASAFLVYSHKPVTSSDLVLLQVANLGKKSVVTTNDMAKVRLLRRVLEKSYPADHPVVLYEVAVNPLVHPRIQRVKLSTLEEQEISFSTTVYVPAVK